MNATTEPTLEEINDHVRSRVREVDNAVTVEHENGSRLWKIEGMPFVALNVGLNWREDVDYIVKRAVEDKLRIRQDDRRRGPTEEEVKEGAKKVAEIVAALREALGQRAHVNEVAAALLCFFGWHR